MPVTLLINAYPYRCGATFDCLDWACSAFGHCWPEGSRWRWTTYRGTYIVRIENGRAIRDDGRELLPQTNDKVTYIWGELIGI